MNNKASNGNGLAELERRLWAAADQLWANSSLRITAKEQREVKKVAKDMLQTLKGEKLVLDWRKRQQSRAMVRLCINEFLDKLPQVYTPEIYEAKCEAVYQHVYDSYDGIGEVVAAN
jgi:type I restriction enzyme, R subunit